MSLVGHENTIKVAVRALNSSYTGRGPTTPIFFCGPYGYIQYMQCSRPGAGDGF